jgi:murein DD-endopeptidase MepM/ murein hydrolase activator NlpD
MNAIRQLKAPSKNVIPAFAVMTSGFFSRLCFVLLCLLINSNAYSSESNTFHVRILPENISQGDVALIKVSPAKGIKSVKYILDNQSFDFYKETAEDAFCAFLAIDMEEPHNKKTISVRIINTDGHKKENKIYFNVLKKEFPVQMLTLPESKVTLSEKNLKRYNREKAEIKKAFEMSIPLKLWNKSFIRPLSGEPTTLFGVKRILNNKPKSPHSGVDLKASEGSPVVSTSDGVVVCVGDYFFSGKSVFIDHGMGIFSMYFHLSSVPVKKGDKVSMGQTIGLAGSTGRSTGPHLHWGIRINDHSVDPFSLLRLFEPSVTPTHNSQPVTRNP